MKNLSVLLILALSVSFLQSCKKDQPTDPTSEVAPELPPQESFVMAFTDFESSDTSSMSSGNTGNTNSNTYFNWFHAATNVVVWNTVLTLNLAIPVLSFAESFKHDPVFQGNATWLWDYNFTGHDGAQYHAELYAKVLLADEEVEWEMYISKAGGFNRVLWYTGITGKNNSYANWTLNHRPNNPQALLKSDYQRNDGNGVEIIRYTNIIPGSPDNGDYLEYRVDGNAGADFDRAYDVYRVKTDNLLEIEWNETNKDGRVKDQSKFQDQIWHCWDTNLQDMDCQ